MGAAATWQVPVLVHGAAPVPAHAPGSDAAAAAVAQQAQSRGHVGSAAAAAVAVQQAQSRLHVDSSNGQRRCRFPFGHNVRRGTVLPLEGHHNPPAEQTLRQQAQLQAEQIEYSSAAAAAAAAAEAQGAAGSNAARADSSAPQHRPDLLAQQPAMQSHTTDAEEGAPQAAATAPPAPHVLAGLDTAPQVIPSVVSAPDAPPAAAQQHAHTCSAATRQAPQPPVKWWQRRTPRPIKHQPLSHTALQAALEGCAAPRPQAGTIIGAPGAAAAAGPAQCAGGSSSSNRQHAASLRQQLETIQPDVAALLRLRQETWLFNFIPVLRGQVTSREGYSAPRHPTGGSVQTLAVCERQLLSLPGLQAACAHVVVQSAPLRERLLARAENATANCTSAGTGLNGFFWGCLQELQVELESDTGQQGPEPACGNQRRLRLTELVRLVDMLIMTHNLLARGHIEA